MVLRNYIEGVLNEGLTVLKSEDGYRISGIPDISAAIAQDLLEYIADFIPTLEYDFDKEDLKEIFEIYLKRKQ